MSLWHRHTFPLREHQRAFFFFLSLFLVPSNRIQFNDSIEYVPYHSAATISRKQQTKRSWFWFTHHSPEWIHVSFANVVWQNRVRFVFLCFFFEKKKELLSSGKWKGCLIYGRIFSLSLSDCLWGHCIDVESIRQGFVPRDTRQYYMGFCSFRSDFSVPNITWYVINFVRIYLFTIE